MEDLRARVISTVLGASSGMAGLLSLTKCSGSVCASCYGCAGAGTGLLLLLAFGILRRNKKEEKDGMA